MHRAYLSLGSNIAPEKHLRAAIEELRARFGTLTVSPVYRSAAVGFEGPEFLNLAVGIDTDLDAHALDAWLHALEDRHGRHRDQPRYASRTLDVDIVLFDEAIIAGPGHLRIPRAELAEAFVNVPLADIAPAVRNPESGLTVAEIRARTDASGLVRTAIALD
ncbi:MAG: 2-amino-4-hydroxy-6-hydroxymethyldihydropteridine diphosphokinase [Rhodanobacteraceae bacterium]